MKTAFYIIGVYLCLFSLRTEAALSASTVWQVQSTASGADTNGGGFVTGSSGTDMSQFDNKNTSSCTGCFSSSANLSTTDAVANGTTTITSATAGFTSAITGNLVYLSGGSGSIAGQWRQATYVNATSITIDATIASSTGMTMNIGGALSTFGGLGAALVESSASGVLAYVKKGNYCVTNTNANVTGGLIRETTSYFIEIVGYNTVRGDLDVANPSVVNAPSVLSASGSGTCSSAALTGTYHIISNSASSNGDMVFRNFTFDCQAVATCDVVNVGTRSITLFNVTVKNCTNGCITNSGGGLHLVWVRATGASGSTAPISAASSAMFTGRYLEIDHNTSSGTLLPINNGSGLIDNVLIHDNSSGTSGHGISFFFPANNYGPWTIKNITCYNIGGSCIFVNNNPSGSMGIISNIIAEGGVNFTSTTNPVAVGQSSYNTGRIVLQNVYGYNTTACSSNCVVAAAFSTLGIQENLNSYSGTVFVNAAGGDFRLNNTATAIAMRGLAYTFPSGGTAAYSHPGAVQTLGSQTGGVH